MSGRSERSGRALVVFGDAAEMWWLHWLKPGFRHCFVALENDYGWVIVDPMAHYTEILALPKVPTFDLAGWYRQQGFSVVETQPITPGRRLAPVRPYTCVEAVKRILGLHQPFVLTPWQFFRYLKSEGKNALTAERDRATPQVINTRIASGAHRGKTLGRVSALSVENKPSP